MPPTISYRLTNTPKYAGWETPHAPGTFLFAFKAVVEIHRELVASELPSIHMYSRRDGRYRNYLAHIEALTWLERKWLGYYQNESDEVTPWPEHLGSLWLVCGLLALEQRFVSVMCSACEATYAPDVTTVREFSWGKSLFGHGGRGLLCPEGHGLYVICQWDS